MNMDDCITIGVPKLLQGPREDGRPNDVRHSDIEILARVAIGARNSSCPFMGRTDQTLGIRQERLAGFGQLQPIASGAGEERFAQFILEGPQALTESRLGHEERIVGADALSALTRIASSSLSARVALRRGSDSPRP